MLELGIIATLFALVWGSVLLWRGSWMAGAMLVIVSGTCFGAHFFNLAAGPIPLTSDRLLLALLAAQYLACRLRGSDQVDPQPLGAAEWTALAFVGVLIFSTVTHDWAANDKQAIRQILFFYLMPLAFYWIARQSTLNERRVRGLFTALAVFGVHLAVTSIAESRGWSFLVFPKYIVNATEAEFLGRGRGPLLNPAGNGIVMCWCLGAAMMLWPRVGRVGQAVLLATALLICAGVYYTLTRSAWMGGALALLITGALVLPRAWRNVTLACVVATGLVVVVTQWEHLLAFKRDKNLSAQNVAESAMARPMLALVAWRMFQDRPILGCGYGQYLAECGDYIADRDSDMPLDKVRPYVQHNALLALLVETGLAGAGLFVALLVLWLRDAWKLWRARSAPLWMRQVGLVFLIFVGGYLPNAMFQDVSIILMVNMLLFFGAGLVRNLAPRVSTVDAAMTANAAPARWPLPCAAWRGTA